MLNKKGAVMLFILFAIAYFFFGMIIYQFLKPDIAIARIDLSCTSPVTSGDMITCLIIGGVIPYFIIAILSTIGGIITQEALK